ncbi:MAG: hypothetical protein B7Y31_11115, partial [Novosphingobium sp. 16-62-11]
MAALGGEADTTGVQAAPLRDWLLLGGAVIASAGALWAVSGEPLVVGGFLGGVGVIGAALRLAYRPARAAVTPDFAAPDWSVTNAAIE